MYAIIWIGTQKIYLGKSLNVPNRLSLHWENLRKQNHEYSELQKDWNQFGEQRFRFIAITVDPVWEHQIKRRQQEQTLIALNKEQVYNKIVLGQLDRDKYQKKVYCKSHLYSSIAEASRGKGYSEIDFCRFLRDPNKLDFYYDPVSLEQNFINHKKAFPVVVHSVVYRSIRATSLATKIPRRTLMRHLSSPCQDYCRYLQTSSLEKSPEIDKNQNRIGNGKCGEE